MSSTTATVPSSEMTTLTSIYIPRVFANLSTEFVAETFESLNLGVVDRIETVPRPGDKKTYMAFVYFASWNTKNKAAANLAERINCPSPGASQARIVYDDPWFWILLPNKSEKSSSSKNLDDVDDAALEEFNRDLKKQEMEDKKLMKEEIEFEEALREQELDTDEKLDILTDMIEDLQVRLRDSEKKNSENEKRIERLQKELYDVREILLTGGSTSALNLPGEEESIASMSVSVLEDMEYPPPPKLVRQNAVAFECPPPPPPGKKIERQITGWWPTDEEVADYKMDRHQRRMKEAGIEQVRVDGMGLVYPNDDSGFWCDP